TLTPYAAPPVLMVADTWGWDLSFMLTHFGWRSALAVFINAAGLTWLFRAELGNIAWTRESHRSEVPAALTLVHLLLLVGIVVFAHHPAVFAGLFLFFMG